MNLTNHTVSVTVVSCFWAFVYRCFIIVYWVEFSLNNLSMVNKYLFFCWTEFLKFLVQWIVEHFILRIKSLSYNSWHCSLFIQRSPSYIKYNCLLNKSIFQFQKWTTTTDFDLMTKVVVRRKKFLTVKGFSKTHKHAQLKFNWLIQSFQVLVTILKYNKMECNCIASAGQLLLLLRKQKNNNNFCDDFAFKHFRLVCKL